MRNVFLSCLAATALIAGCGGGGGSSSSDQTNEVPECPEAGTQPSDACLATGGGDFLKSKNGGFGYKILFPEQHKAGTKLKNTALVVFDKNQCSSAMAAQGTGSFRPWMFMDNGMDHGLEKFADRVRTVRSDDCKNVFLVTDITYLMGGKWEYHLEPSFVEDKADAGFVTHNVKGKD